MPLRLRMDLFGRPTLSNHDSPLLKGEGTTPSRDSREEWPWLQKNQNYPTKTR